MIGTGALHGVGTSTGLRVSLLAMASVATGVIVAAVDPLSLAVGAAAVVAFGVVVFTRPVLACTYLFFLSLPVLEMYTDFNPINQVTIFKDVVLASALVGLILRPEAIK